MASVYFHPGALVHLCTAVSGNELAAALWDGADLVATSAISDLEVRTVLSGGLRLGKLEYEAHARAAQRWQEMWPALWRVRLADEVLQRAVELEASHTLRPTDAIHLASAELLESDELVLLGWGEQFVAAARAEGLAVLA